MAHSINTTPLLRGESESDNEDEITDVPQHQQSSLEEEIVVNDDDKPLFKPSEPRDKYHMAYFIFYLLGMVTLLPWNFFITADDYWLYKFRDVHKNVSYIFTSHVESKRTPLQAGFTSYLSVASAVPNIIFLFLNTAVSQRISLNKRVNGSLTFILILFIMTTVFVHVDTDQWQQIFFIITILSVVLLNAASAILAGSIFGVIGKFSPKYITATLGGQALGGIFAALAEIIALSIGASSVHSAFVYFMVGNVTIFISIVFYVILSKSIFFKFHLHQKSTLDEFQNELVKPRIICHRTILRKIWMYGTAMFMTFAVTLAVYPGVTVLIESEGKGSGNKWNDVFFVPTIAYMLFSIGDYLGRILAGKFQKPRKRNTLLILSVIRLLMAPLLMLCNAQPRHYLPVVFNKDYEYILILFFFALSNGYLANITAICAPRVVEQHEKEMASSMMTIFMGVGLAFGSSLSLIMVKLL